MYDFDEALACLLAKAQRVSDIETVPIQSALGRVLAIDQQASFSFPQLDTAAMDGYAVRAADVSYSGISLPVSQRITAGQIGAPLECASAARIFTGAPLPEGANAVIMQELCEHHDQQVSIKHVPEIGESVRMAGSEIVLGERLLQAGERLQPQHIALAAAIGVGSLPVWRRLRVTLFSSGDELVMPGQALPPGQIYNSNSFQLRALLSLLGCEVCDLGVMPDRLEETRQCLRAAALGQDVILSSGGVSVGEEDHIKPAVEAEGRLDLWKIAMKPGKPFAFGRIGDAAFIGLPGNPVSSFVTFGLLVRPFLLTMQGQRKVLPRTQQLPAAFAWSRCGPRREFLRGRSNEQGEIELFPHQGSATMSSLVWADGLIDVPPQTSISRGELVRFISFEGLLHA